MKRDFMNISGWAEPKDSFNRNDLTLMNRYVTNILN